MPFSSSSANAEQSSLQRCRTNCETAAYRIASRQGVHVTRTLALLCQAISQGILTAETVSSIADELLETDYRLPFGKGEFEIWAVENLPVSP